jgi:hypothetical protein
MGGGFGGGRGDMMFKGRAMMSESMPMAAPAMAAGPVQLPWSFGPSLSLFLLTRLLLDP